MKEFKKKKRMFVNYFTVKEHFGRGLSSDLTGGGREIQNGYSID